MREVDSMKRAMTAALGSDGFEVTYLPPGLIQLMVGNGDGGKYVLRCSVVDITDDLAGVLTAVENIFDEAQQGIDQEVN
jgi:hypothetical protein